MHYLNNYCAVTMMISAIQTDSQEREAREYLQINEFIRVGMGIKGEFKNTKQLHMATDDKYCWESAVEEEGNNMDKYDVWMRCQLQDLMPDEK